MTQVSNLLITVGIQGVDGVVRGLRRVNNEQAQLGEGAEQGADAFGKLGNVASKLGDSLGKSGGKLGTFGKYLSSTGRTMSDLGGTTGGLAGSTAELGSALSGASAGLIAVGGAAAAAVVAYTALDAASVKAAEGAELLWEKQKFNALAMSEFGITGEEALSVLRTETRGLANDYKLIEVGTRLMQLGLVDSIDDVATLTDGFVQMGWSVDQLSRAISNQSFDQIDNLMLNRGNLVAFYNENLEAGMDKEAAYAQALLSTYRQQKEIIGDIGEAELGVWKRRDAARENLQNDMKEWWGDKLGWFGELQTLTYEMLDLAFRPEKIKEALNAPIQPLENVVDAYGVVKDQLDALFMDESISYEGYVIAANELNAQLEYAEENGIGAQNAMSMFNNTLQAAKGSLTGMSDLFGRNYGPWTKDMAMSVENTGASFLTAKDHVRESYDAMGKFLEQGYDIRKLMETGSHWTDTYGNSMIKLTTEFYCQSAAITALGSDWGSMRAMAEAYDAELSNISKANERIKQLEPFAETGGYIDGVWMSAKKVKEELEGLYGVIEESEKAMERFANKMTLDMLQTTLGIGGYTEAEINTLVDFMVQAGMIGTETAEKMKQDYLAAIDEVNAKTLEAKVLEFEANFGKLIEDYAYIDGQFVNKKTLEVDADLTAFYNNLAPALKPYFLKLFVNLDTSEVDNWLPPKKRLEVIARMGDTSDVDNWGPPTKTGTVNYTVGYNPIKGPNQALGGPVYGNEPYIVGERGPELFVPSVAGQIVPNWQVTSTAQIDEDKLARAMKQAFKEAVNEMPRVTTQTTAFENIARWR